MKEHHKGGIIGEYSTSVDDRHKEPKRVIGSEATENLYRGKLGKVQDETNEMPGRRGDGGATGYVNKDHSNAIPSGKKGTRGHGPE